MGGLGVQEPLENGYTGRMGTQGRRVGLQVRLCDRRDKRWTDLIAPSKLPGRKPKP